MFGFGVDPTHGGKSVANAREWGWWGHKDKEQAKIKGQGQNVPSPTGTWHCDLPHSRASGLPPDIIIIFI